MAPTVTNVNIKPIDIPRTNSDTQKSETNPHQSIKIEDQLHTTNNVIFLGKSTTEEKKHFVQKNAILIDQKQPGILQTTINKIKTAGKFLFNGPQRSSQSIYFHGNMQHLKNKESQSISLTKTLSNIRTSMASLGRSIQKKASEFMIDINVQKQNKQLKLIDTFMQKAKQLPINTNALKGYLHQIDIPTYNRISVKNENDSFKEDKSISNKFQAFETAVNDSGLSNFWKILQNRTQPNYKKNQTNRINNLINLTNRISLKISKQNPDTATILKNDLSNIDNEWVQTHIDKNLLARYNSTKSAIEDYAALTKDSTSRPANVIDNPQISKEVTTPVLEEKQKAQSTTTDSDNAEKTPIFSELPLQEASISLPEKSLLKNSTSNATPAVQIPSLKKTTALEVEKLLNQDPLHISNIDTLTAYVRQAEILKNSTDNASEEHALQTKFDIASQQLEKYQKSEANIQAYISKMNVSLDKGIQPSIEAKAKYIRDLEDKLQKPYENETKQQIQTLIYKFQYGKEEVENGNPQGLANTEKELQNQNITQTRLEQLETKLQTIQILSKNANLKNKAHELLGRIKEKLPQKTIPLKSSESTPIQEVESTIKSTHQLSELEQKVQNIGKTFMQKGLNQLIKGPQLSN